MYGCPILGDSKYRFTASYPKKKEIQNEISSIFPNAEHWDSGRQTHPKDAKSTYDRFDFNFDLILKILSLFIGTPKNKSCNSCHIIFVVSNRLKLTNHVFCI